jgi:uncharacterized repeat protein (TIGR03803 family)
LVGAVVGGSTHARAQTVSLIHNFSTAEGEHPYSGLTMDASGNLYGVTYVGGTHGKGIAYRLSPPGPSGTTWTESVLWNFGLAGDGGYPTAGVIIDSSGVLWGTTSAGGAITSAACPPGCGTFYTIANVAGVWGELPLFSFGAAGAGYWPFNVGSLIQDSNGSFYGTTSRGGANNDGAVVKLTVGGSGTTEEVIYSFDATTAHKDGINPEGALAMDSSGNLYGTTVKGGIGDGTLFKLTSNGPGVPWTETILHTFLGVGSLDGSVPVGRVIVDPAGNIFGTTQTGGLHNLGTVFEASPDGLGGWTFTTIHNFGATGDGYHPLAGLLRDASGNLYGTTESGGATTNGKGTVFKLGPASGGAWNYTIMHTFVGGPTDGADPISELIMDASGALYGTTYDGGAISPYGAVFKIVP